MSSHLERAGITAYSKQKKTLRYTTVLFVVFCNSYASICFATEAHLTEIPAIESHKSVIDPVVTSSIYFSEVIQLEPSIVPHPPEKSFFTSLLDSIFRSQTKKRIQKWHALIETYKGQHYNNNEQMERTNLFFNQLRFRSDNKHWDIEDYWATPIEMLTTNGGDCEDFSIAKFFTLKEMGVDENQMRMIYVESTLAEQHHMVLAYYPTQNNDPLILDNLMDDIKLLSERDDLLPVYSFNEHGIWIEKSKQLSIKISETNYISHWKTLKAKMEKEASIDPLTQ